MKQTVIIYSNYVEISRKGERLFVKTPKTKSSIPLSNIDGILIFGKSYLTSEAISLCMKKQIPIILFTIYGKIKGQILPPAVSEATNKRIKQFGLYFFERLEIAKYLVKMKITEIEHTFNTELEELKLKIDKATDYASLLGIEGIATKVMFQKFEKMIRDKGFKFLDRNYHPPKDEANALLSFVYILGYNLATGVIILKGFDPFISFLHSKRGKHAVFASDLMEIIRPKLTLFSAKLIIENKIIKEDFVKENNYFLLKKQAIYKILEEFNQFKEELITSMKKFLTEFENFNF
uniref:CRISPR-associated endonuclease Cas1 n=1 Tax=Thermodesulfobacterium geofontis TaxID=1295609 RepID=A0A7V4N407_9BACT